MNNSIVPKSLLKLIADFRAADRGNVVMTFALATIPVIGATGAAVDYSRASSARAAMQSSLDSAALILSKEAQKLSSAQLLSKADALFRANFNRPEVTGIVITPTFSNPSGGSFTLTLAGEGTLQTTFTGIWQPTMVIGAQSEVLWGMKRLELALALDNTGSMASSGKMTQLKIAAKDLIKTLQTASKKTGDVKISIVPFATDVNMGKANHAASWINWEEWDEDNGDDVKEKTCTSKKGKKKKCTTSTTWVPDNHNTWNGCVMDRDQQHDVKNTATDTAIKTTLFYANQADNCPVAMMGLSEDWSAMNAKIDSMTPTGNTNVTIGLSLAFQTLSPVAPFNASAPHNDLDKVIILLTDGENTENRWSTTPKTIDARTKLACENVKAANIKLYTIRVIDGNATLLKECATKPDMYFNVQSASELSGAFGAIAQNLANLRLAK